MKTAVVPARGDPLWWPPRRSFYLNPLLADPPSWPIAYMDGATAYGWVKGIPVPQPLPIWLEGQRRLPRTQ